MNPLRNSRPSSTNGAGITGPTAPDDLLVSAPLITHNRNDYLGVPGLTLISHGQ
jgi:hypothetical protein